MVFVAGRNIRTSPITTKRKRLSLTQQQTQQQMVRVELSDDSVVFMELGTSDDTVANPCDDPASKSRLKGILGRKIAERRMLLLAVLSLLVAGLTYLFLCSIAAGDVLHASDSNTLTDSPTFVGPRVHRQLAREGSADHSPEVTSNEPITPREEDDFELVAQGGTQKEQMRSIVKMFAVAAWQHLRLYDFFDEKSYSDAAIE